MNRFVLAGTALAALAALTACDRSRGLNPFSSGSPFQEHCRKVLAHLVSTESGRVRPSVEDVSQRERGAGTTTMAVTIVYVQADSRRILTCTYAPDRPNAVTGISYRGEGLLPDRVAAVNAAVAGTR